jgi:hypothetical protein
MNMPAEPQDSIRGRSASDGKDKEGCTAQEKAGPVARLECALQDSNLQPRDPKSRTLSS